MSQEPPKPPSYAAPAAFTKAGIEASKAASKFTEKRRQTILAALQGGHMESTAASLAGIGVQTLRDWLRIGATDLDNDVESEYATFTELAMQCIATAEARALKVIMDKIASPGPEQVQTAKWFLEARHRKTWGKTAQVEVSHVQDGPVVIQLEWPGARHTVAPPAIEAESSEDDDIEDAVLVEPESVETDEQPVHVVVDEQPDSRAAAG